MTKLPTPALDPRANEILNKIRERALGREINIRTLNTIDTNNTKILNTRDYDTSTYFAQPSYEEPSRNTGHLDLRPAGIASLERQPLEGNDSSQDYTAPPKITYMAVSLKNPTGARRTLNVDFRTATTPAGKFNKIVFNLTDRAREFYSNLPSEFEDDINYSEAFETFVTLDARPNSKWLGKGRKRGRFVDGELQPKRLKKGLTAVLEQRANSYYAEIWIESIKFQVELTASKNPNYPFKGQVIEDNQPMTIEQEGGWL